MKHPVSLIFLLISLLLPAASARAVDDVVEKTYCTQGIAYESIDDLKLDLLNNAKRSVINELFGEFIVASTAVENFVVTKDQIQTSSIGFVRLEGNTDFHNGKDFADVCVTIRAYVTFEDREKFEPEKLEKKYCDADDDMTTAQLIAYVKDEAVIQALVEYNPKLKGADKDKLLQLVQKITYRGNGFITDTQTYCATFEGYVVPVEIMAFLGPNSETTTHNEDLVIGGDSVTIIADYYGDGKPETAIWNPPTGEWFVPRNDTTLRKNGSYHIVKLGTLGDVPVLADYSGDGKLDIAVWRPASGNWYISNADGFQTQNDSNYFIVQCGSARYGDIPVPGDYDGDGMAEVAVWRPSEGNWYISYENSSWKAVSGHTYAAIQWGGGGLGDIPVPADYDGDGKTEIAVWRASTGDWYISYDNHSWANRGTAYDILHLGIKGDVPLPNDWDNDGKAEIAIGRPSDGKLYISTENRSWEDAGNEYIIRDWQR